VTHPMLTAAIEVCEAWDDPTDDECCVFVQAVVERAYGLPPATGLLLSAWRVFDIEEPWSPAYAAVGAGPAVRVIQPFEHPLVGLWHVVQGWRGTPGAPGVTGHTFLWLQVTETHGIRLDASDGRKVRDVLHGFEAWAEYIAQFRGGVAVAVLRPVPVRR
jgi:hypothetical protein